MSLRELWREFAVARAAQRRERNHVVTLAWHIDAMRRQEKLPDLKRLLDAGQPRAQSVSEQRVQLEAIAKMYGLKMHTGKRRRRGQ